jgi:hypothetical protein
METAGSKNRHSGASVSEVDFEASIQVLHDEAARFSYSAGFAGRYAKQIQQYDKRHAVNY